MIPYDDTCPACERADVRLAIYCGDLDADEVTARLRLAPTKTTRVGNVVVNRIGRSRTERLNAWFLVSEGQVESLDLRRHLDWLLDKIEPCADELRVLQHVPGIKMYLRCVWWSVCGYGGPVLSPAQMVRMAALNLECDFDVYFFGPPED